MFSVIPRSSNSLPAVVEEKKKQILDIKRSQNVCIIFFDDFTLFIIMFQINIGLAQFKNFSSFPELCKAIADFNIDILPTEKLQTLKDMVPTDAELKLVNEVKCMLFP